MIAIGKCKMVWRTLDERVIEIQKLKPYYRCSD